MPSSAIHISSVTSCRPLGRASKSASAQIDHANVHQRAERAPERAATRGRGAAARATPRRRAARAGWREGGSRGLDQEVEDHGAGADEQQRGVGAQEARLQRAHGGRAGADEPDVPPTSVPLTKMRSKVCWPKRPNQPNGRDDAQSISSSKYHLLTKGGAARANALADAPAISPSALHPDRGRRWRCPAGRAPRRGPGRATSSPSLGWCTTVESANVGSRKCRATSSILRDQHDAADRREHGQRAHRELHGQRVLGDVVLGAGEADVGVLDLAGRRVGRARRGARWPVLELARLARPARRRRRGRSSATCRSAVMSAPR